MARIETTVTMTNIYKYEAPAFGYGYEERYIYTMTAEDGTVYVWKTTTFMVYEYEDEKGWLTKRNGKTYNTQKVDKGDVIKITATVKGESEYKGQPQTEVNRVRVLSVEFKAETWEEKQARLEAERKARVEEQMNSIKGDDFVWEMPYKQFKEHYSDCETIEGSFRRNRNGDAFIKVIIREGRLKASGVRGRHYKGYQFMVTVNGEEFWVVYRAITENNALERVKRDYPDATEIVPKEVYTYRH